MSSKAYYQKVLILCYKGQALISFTAFDFWF